MATRRYTLDPVTAGFTPRGAKPDVIGSLKVAPDSFGDGGQFVDPGNEEVTSADLRLVGSVATATCAMLIGASLVRVHDAKAVEQAATVVAGER